ncbi:MAG: hypothetical protein FWD17_15975 [Polyangiaceae bacterium]|nr:hypothetical protein [Polyangiaceae bacterium]
MRIRFALSIALASMAGACGGHSKSGTGNAGTIETSGDGGLPPAIVTDGGFSLRPAPPVDPNGLQNTTLVLSASGESLALDGYNFPAQNQGDGVFADGWQVRFSHFVATFDKVMLWQNPDFVPTDQSQVGPLVAELDGPWAVDLHADGDGWPYIDGKEQGERAVVFGVVPNQNKQTGAPGFPTDGTRFAVGFSAVVATPNALNVNLDADALAAYARMVDEHCTVLYVGQATWKGDQETGLCVSPTDAGIPGVKGGVGGEPEFALIPTVVNFDLCYKPADSGGLQPGDAETSWINCDNQDNDPAPGLNGEPHERGVAFFANKYTVGEVTFHTDHPFWESTEHDTPLRFDPFAAQVVGVSTDGGVPTVHLTDVTGVDYTWLTDKLGNLLPWRTCDPFYLNPNNGNRSGTMSFDPHGVPHCAGGDHATGLCDFYDFSKYNQSTQGHWNGADGLCFVTRHYPSPP